MVVYQDGYIKFIRDRVGHDLIYLVYAIGIVLNEAGHILVQRRYEFNWWDLVGGAKEIGESIQACMIRETYEECGLHIKIERPVGVYSHPHYTIQYPHGDWVQPWAVAFVCRAVGGSLNPDGKEILGAEFKPLDELLPHPHAIFDTVLRDAFPERTVTSAARDLTMEPPFVRPNAKPFFPVLRRVIPREPVILPGALALVYDESGRILVTRRAAFGSWDIPGGFSDLGETVAHTAVREVYEETGLRIEPLRALGIYSDPALMYGEYPNGDQVYGVGLLIEARVTGGVLNPDGEEVLAAAFLTLDEIMHQSNLHPLTRQVLLDIEKMEARPFVH